MKIFHKFWQNQLSSQKIFNFCFFSLLWSLTGAEVYAQTSAPMTPGMFESLETLIEIDKKKFQELPVLEPWEGTYSSKTTISESYFTSILFNAPRDKMVLMEKNPCAFVDFLAMDQFQVGGKKITNFPLLDQFKNKEFLATANGYVKYQANSSCLSSKTGITKFKDEIDQRRIANRLIAVPETYDSCYTEHQRLLVHPESAFYCSLINQAKLGEQSALQLNQTSEKNSVRLLRKDVVSYQRIRNFLGADNYRDLSLFCDNVLNPEKFCDFYLKSNFFERILTNKNYLPALEAYCGFMDSKSSTFTSQTAKACLDVTKIKPEICYSNSPTYSAFSPKNSCDVSSEVLSKSRLIYPAYDCPGKVFNEMSINISRIINYFDIFKDNYHFDSKYLGCTESITLPFITLAEKFEQLAAWGAEACFKNGLKNKTLCQSISFNANPSRYSFKSFIEKVIADFKNIKSPQCEFMHENEYNPNSIQHKSGCLILINEKKCSAENCQFKIMLSGREIDPIISLKFAPKGWYTSTDKKNLHISFQYILANKSNLKQKLINNFSEISLFFKEKSKGLIHGIGCSEDLLPQYFPRKNMRSCSPLPFIISGSYNQEQGVIVNLSIDNNLTPRNLPWSFVFKALKNYQQTHPTREWSIYALYL